MDKYDLVLDIIEHPMNYSSQELEVIFADSETREIYNILSKADSAIRYNKDINVDAEWDVFSKGVRFRSHRFKMRGGRAASIIVIVCTSIVAMAVGIAVAVSGDGNKTESRPGIETMNKADNIAIPSAKFTDSSNLDESDKTDSPILFEDEKLSAIMEVLSATYGVDVKFKNEDVASLHLYYRFDPSLDIYEVVSQLNTFESINITKQDNLLIIE